MAKLPLLGYCKTRLVPHLSQQRALALADALLKDHLYFFDNQPEPVELFLGSPCAITRLSHVEVLNRPHHLLINRSLAAALQTAWHLVRHQRTWRFVTFVGTDAPIAVVNHFSQARAALNRNCMILGPTDDGGIYLLSVDTSIDINLQIIPWESNQVFNSLQNLARALGLDIRILPKGRDIDTWTDFCAARDYIVAHNLNYPHTAKLIKAWTASAGTESISR